MLVGCPEDVPDELAKYRYIRTLGRGAFGEVILARKEDENCLYALKKCRVPGLDEGLPVSLLREIEALKQLRHPNVWIDKIIRLFNILAESSSLVLVMEAMEVDLGTLLKRHRGDKRALTEGHQKAIMQMLLRGVSHMHKLNIEHRDLKPSNLLFSRAGNLKIADLGQSRAYCGPGRVYSHHVSTRWYRAPELLLGSRSYTPAVDLWAVGAIMGELLYGSPLFPGDNDIDQIYRVVQVMGKPTQQNWPGVEQQPDYDKVSFPDWAAVPLLKLLPDAPQEAVSLLALFLVYNPDGRLSAEQALDHPWFYSSPFPASVKEHCVARTPKEPSEAPDFDTLMTQFESRMSLSQILP